jgi:hypothetical protein
MLGNVGPRLRAQAKAGKCPGRERVEEFTLPASASSASSNRA